MKTDNVFTGLRELDGITDGFHPGELIVVASRPAMGKTAFLISLALNNAKKWNLPVLFISPESSAEKIMARMVSSSARISSYKIRKDILNEKEAEIVKEKAGELKKLPIYFYDRHPVTVTDIESHANYVKAEHGLKLIVVDDLPLLYSELPFVHTDESKKLATATMIELRALAKNIGVPVFVTACIDGTDFKVKNARPTLADARNADIMTAYADKIFFLHRDEHYLIEKDEDGNSTKDIAEILVAKNGSGLLGTARQSYISNYAVFQDIYEETFID